MLSKKNIHSCPRTKTIQIPSKKITLVKRILMIRKLISFIIIALSIAGTARAEETYLLSNNLSGRSGVGTEFSEWPESLKTEMQIEWVSSGEFASDEEAIKTGSGRVLFDGNTGSNWKSVAYTKWSGSPWVTLNLSFEREYLIKAVDVWALHEQTRDTKFVEILSSEDGETYVSCGRVQMPEIPLQKKNFVKIPLRLESPLLAKYIQVRIARKPGAKQQQIADIAIWGSLPEDGKVYAKPSVKAPAAPKAASVAPRVKPPALASGDIYLLSNNMDGKPANQAFSEWPQSLNTRMQVEWVTTGEFASDAEAMETGSGRVLFDGNTGSNWKSVAYSKWSGSPWVTLNISFEQDYLIDAVDVWALHEQTRDTESVEILFSKDGETYTSHQIAQMPNIPLQSKNFVKIPLRLEEPLLAQHIQLRIKRKPSAKQQQIADIGIWGRLPSGGKAYTQPAEPPRVQAPSPQKATKVKAAGKPTAHASAGTYLLSNNMGGHAASEDFSEWPQSLATEMKIEWVSTGEFASDAEAMETGAGRVLFDGNTGSNWKSIAYSKWGGGKWITLNLSFEAEYLIEAVDVWALHEETRDTEFVEILFSEDGKTYIPHQRAPMPDLPFERKNFVKIPLRLDQPVLAKYLQLRIHRKPSAKQQQIADIAIWGSSPVAGKQYLQANDRPEVDFTVQTVQAGVVNLNWDEFRKLNPSVQSWTIYSSPQPFDSIQDAEVQQLKKVSSEAGRTTLYPLTAGQTYHFAVSAVFAEGENPKVKSIKCTMPQPLAYDTFSDMVAINHFWGGGGNRANEAGRDVEAYETVALDLLAKTGITHIRWWKTDRNIIEKFYDKGIGLYTYPYGNNMDKGIELGVHVFSGPGNEPDLKTTPIETYVTNLKKVHEKKERLSPESIICAPSSGLEDHSIEWLEKFYALGGKDYFEVLDLHSYCKIAGGHIQPEGYPKGAPEAMYDNMRKVREILTKYDDLDKPVISTEFGYSESPANNPSGHITPQTKADYLVRGLIIHNVLGFKRVFLYSFFDEGNDINFTEHNFGMIDYDLQKKPAFYAVQTLMKTLGDGIYQGPVPGVELPAFAYSYSHRDSELNTVVLWDGTQNRIAKFKTTDAEVTLTKLKGERLTLIPNKQGIVAVPYGPSPIYLSSSSELTFVSSEAAKTSSSDDVWAVRPALEKVIVDQGQQQLSLPLNLEGSIQDKEDIRVIVSDPNSRVILDQEMTIKPGDETLRINLSLDSLQDPLQKLKLQVVQQNNGLSVSKEYFFYLRRLQDIKSKSQPQLVRFPDVEQPVYMLSNEYITATIDAARGGRVLEIIDNQSLTNQVNIDYAVLPNLPSIPFAYGIWTKINGKLKNAPLEVLKANAEELTLQGKIGNLVMTQSWRLNKSALELHIDVANQGTATEPLTIEVHPEYNVGGLGESVTDVLYFPAGQRVERIPFWSGLGQKDVVTLTDNWWAALDTTMGLSLEQQIVAKDWSAPRLWFSQGCYNIELKTATGLQIEGNQNWATRLSWILKNDQDESIFISRKIAQ